MGLTIGLEGREHARRNRGGSQRKRRTRERSQMRKSWILTLTGLGFAALTAPARAQDITIAVAGPMTGPVASIGETDETRRRDCRRSDQRRRRGERPQN